MIYLHIIKEDWNHDLFNYMKDGYLYFAYQLDINSRIVRDKIYEDSLEKTVNIIMRKNITKTRHWLWFPHVIMEYSKDNIKILKDSRG